MDKKRFITFAILAVLSIFCAFLIVSYFAPSSNKDDSSNDKFTISKDFIDVDNNIIDDTNKGTSETNSSSKLEEQNSSIKNEDKNNSSSTTTVNRYDSNNNLSEVSDSYKSYIEDSSNTGFYDLSDVGNTILNNYEDTLNNEQKVSDEEVSFFNDLKTLADNYTLAYEEMLSYVLLNDLDGLKKYLDSDYKNSIEEFNNLNTVNNEKFEKIKDDYYNGMLQAQEGFNVYIANPTTEDCNKYFLKSDEYFYNGQSKLEELLEDYK